MNEALCICDAKIGHCAISDLTGISKVVDLTVVMSPKSGGLKVTPA